MFIIAWITGHTHNITRRDSCRPPRNSRRSSLYITYAYTPRRTRKIKQTPCQAPLNLPRTYEPNTTPLAQPHTRLHTRPWQHHTLSHHSRCSQARPFCLHCDSSPRLINALCLVVFTLLLSLSREHINSSSSEALEQVFALVVESRPVLPSLILILVEVRRIGRRLDRRYIGRFELLTH